MKKIQMVDALAEQSKKVERVLSHEKFDFINIQLKQGEFIPQHNAKDVVIIIVRKGSVSFEVEGQEVMLTEEDSLVLDPLEMHSLKAVTDTDIVVLKLK